jgi:aryl-alcohol dehydrogenase-like predicted oxidoreductase
MTARFVSERTLATTERLIEVARQAGMSPVTLAVAWTLAHDFVGSTIIGATRAEQLTDSLAASGVSLSQDVLAACEKITREIPYPLG